MLQACGLLTPAAVGNVFKWAAEADPAAQLCLNEWGVLEGNNYQGFVELTRALLELGAPVHCLGVQVSDGVDWLGWVGWAGDRWGRGVSDDELLISGASKPSTPPHPAPAT